MYDLPWGLDTRIGEQGLALSGGQRQRLALARAVISPAVRARARRPALRPRREHRGPRRGEPGTGAARHDGSARGTSTLHRRPRRPCRAPRERRAVGGGDPQRAHEEARVRGSSRRRIEPVPGGVVTAQDKPEGPESADTPDTADIASDKSDNWRGVAAESVDDLPSAWTGLLRKRTRRLLGSLSAPHRRAIVLLAFVILVANLASVAVPWLVGVGIDRGIPAVRRGDYSPIATVTGAHHRLCRSAGSALPDLRRRLRPHRPADPPRPATSASSPISSASASPSTRATRPAG